MQDKNTEKATNIAPVIPVPAQQQATPVATKVEVVPATLAVADKTTQAFIKLRQERTRLKQELATEKAKTAVPVDPVPQASDQPKQVAIAPVVPAPKAEDTIAEERAAIERLAMDPEVMQVPGGIIDILDAIDANPRLAKLYAIDHTIALREAKSLWAQKLGLAPTPIVPMATSSSGGMGRGDVNNDLDAIYRQFQATKPGTARYRQLAKQYNEARTRMGV